MDVRGLSKMLGSKRGSKAPVSRPVEYSAPTIEIRNSFCTLHSFPAEAIAALTELLTYENKDVQFDINYCFRMIESAKRKQNKKMQFVFVKRLNELKEKRIVCWLKQNRFPTGHLDLVREAALDLGVVFEVADFRVLPQTHHIFRWKNPPPTPRYYQREMVDLALKHGRGVFEAAVGSGKSLIACLLTKELGVTTLVIVPSAALLEQFGRSLEEHFGKSVVTRVSTKQVKAGKKLGAIRIVTIQTLAALQKQGLVKAALADVGLVIVDEIHHAGSDSYAKLLPHLDHVYYRIGLTGTFLRNDSKTLDMWGFLSNRLYEYTARQATADGFLTPVDFIIETLPGKSSGNYQKEYDAHFCGNPVLLQAILRRLQNLPSDDQVLILVDRKEKSGQIIHEFLTENGYENAYISGDDKREEIVDAIESFNDKQIRILIGSTVIGEGVDVHSTVHLFLCTGGKSVVKIVQAIGRCVRLSPGKTSSFVYDYNFRGTRFLSKHSVKRADIYDANFASEKNDNIRFEDYTE